MTSIKLVCSGVEVQATVNGTLTAGAVGINVCIEFIDNEWDSLTKDIVFKSNGVSYGVVYSDDVIIVVPHESLIAGKNLYVGITGHNQDKSIVIPTMWANCGIVEASAIGSYENSVPPTPTVMEQILDAASNAANEASKYALEAKNSVDNAKMVFLEIDQNGDLIMKSINEPSVSFSLNENGDLEAIYK